MPDPSTAAATRLADLLERFCLRLYPAVLEQHSGPSISSPLGIWLLVAAVAAAAEGGVQVELEAELGCSTGEAFRLLTEVLADPPPALSAALALWVRPADETPRFAAFAAGLPREVERGPVPTQAEADAWASERTLGLVARFPLALDERTRLVLASALATRVSWREPYDLVPARDGFSGGAWMESVQQALYRHGPGREAFLARTEAAGIVAVHVAEAVEQLLVVSVCAAPEVERLHVLAAAHEVVRLLRGTGRATRGATPCSLFDVPLGAGHSWWLDEHEVTTHLTGERHEWIRGVALPAWHAAGELDLTPPAFGLAPAGSALLGLIGSDPSGDAVQARQTTVAAYGRVGFTAAAVTAIAVQAGAMRPDGPEAKGVARTAELRFHHPHVALAVAGTASGGAWAGVPLFTAWVAEPVEPELEPPSFDRVDER